MPTRRLEQQYLKLRRCFGAEPVSVTLQELADRLCCTRRHMRNLLLQMQQRGWIAWQAKAGRGRRSRLQLLRNEQQLLSDKAEGLLESGRFNEAFSLLGEEKQLIAPLLRARLGFSVRSDQQCLRVPYYRTMLNLYPGTSLRRSEWHLIRQLFNGLTRIKEENEEVAPDLAHHWRMEDPLHWRFYLRPAVQFHDGRELQAADVVASLTRAAALPLFSHIREVREAGPLSVVIRLAEPDPRLPVLLASTWALILPADHAARPDFASRPVGTGPYRVADNDEWHLRLRAFDGYFGLRALLDEVEILMWPELTEPPQADRPEVVQAESDSPQPFVAAERKRELSRDSATWLSSSLSDAEYAAGVAAGLSGSPSDPCKEMFLEQGGYFLLCDSRSSYWHGLERRRWLQQILNPYLLAQQLSESIRHLWVPATSMLPNWCHPMDASPAASPFATQPGDQGRQGWPVLRLAYHEQHPEFPMLAEAMRTLLAAERIALELVELDYTRWAAGDADVDLWLGTVNFPVPVNWHAGAWLLGTPLLHHGLAGGDAVLLAQWQRDWRGERLDSERLVWQVVRSGWLQPLFHHWMRLKGPAQAQGIHLNNLGWFDFKSTWLEPG